MLYFHQATNFSVQQAKKFVHNVIKNIRKIYTSVTIVYLPATIINGRTERYSGRKIRQLEELPWKQ